MSNQYSSIKKGSERSFGIFFSLVFFILAFYPSYEDKLYVIFFILIGTLFLVISVIKPKFLKPLNNIWYKFGILLGLFVSPIIMMLVFCAVVTPTGILMRIFNKDILGLKFDKLKKSYWITRNKETTKMKNQF